MSELPTSPAPQEKPSVQPEPTIRQKFVKYGRAFGTALPLLASACGINIGQHSEHHEPAPAGIIEPSYDASLPSIEDTTQKLREKNPYAQTKIINISSIQRGYDKEDFKPLDYTNEAGDRKVFGLTNDTAPVLEVEYDPNKGMVYTDQSPKGLVDSDTATLLSVFASSNAVLNTAFKSGSLDRIVVRIRENVPDYTYDDMWYGEFFDAEKTRADGLPQKTVFAVLPSSGIMQSSEMADVIRHETFHSLTADISAGLDAQQPSPEDMKTWKDTCATIRKAALGDIGVRYSSISTLMDVMSHQIPDNQIKTVFDEVKSALKNGTLNTLEPTTESPWGDAIDIQECRVQGPWRIFSHLLKERGLIDSPSSLFDSKDPKWSGFSNSAPQLLDDWGHVLDDTSLYKVITESTYNRPAQQDSSLGHPHDDWDELVTSTINAALTYPDNLTQLLATASPQERQLTFDVISKSLDLLKRYPSDAYPELAQLVSDSRTKLGV